MQHQTLNQQAAAVAPTEAMSAEPALMAVALPAHRAWLVPLLEAVSDPAIAAAPVKVAPVVTYWGGVPEQQDQPEHALYVESMCRIVHQRLPWLLPLLDAACAHIAISPGVFCFMVRTRMGQQFEIPELLPFTFMLPWATDIDKARMQ